MKMGAFKLAEKLKSFGNPDSIFATLSEFSVVESLGSQIPNTRQEEGYYDKNENYWISSTTRRILSGDIDANTLVIADTGHGLTIASVMARYFGSDIHFFMPDDCFSDVARNRIASQAQSFSRDIEFNKSSKPAKGASTLLVFDCHDSDTNRPLSCRNRESVVEGFQDAKALKDMGITKIFYASEQAPLPGGPKPIQKSMLNGPSSILLNWMADIQNSGLGIACVKDGIDTRPSNAHTDLSYENENSLPLSEYSAIFEKNIEEGNFPPLNIDKSYFDLSL